MEEMQRLIGRRAAESGPRPLTIATEPIVMTKTPEHQHLRDGSKAEDVARSMDELASHVDRDLAKAARSLEQVHSDLGRLTSTLAEVRTSIEILALTYSCFVEIRRA